jgi:hypothetical protein
VTSVFEVVFLAVTIMIPLLSAQKGVHDATESHSPKIVAGINGVQDQTGVHRVGPPPECCNQALRDSES